jgi:hypothetical protein
MAICALSVFLPETSGQSDEGQGLNQHAKNAIGIFYFALAQKHGAPQKDGAFQASSPIKLNGVGSK